MDHTPTCPKCSCNRFNVSATLTTLAIVEFTGDDHEVLDETQGDLEWDDDSDAECRECGHEAPLGEMKEA